MAKMSIAELEELMEQLADKGSKVHVVDCDGTEYDGTACDFTKADDEENGYATFFVDYGNDDGMGLASNEIETLEAA